MTTAAHRTTAPRQRMLQGLRPAGLSPRPQEAYLRAARQLADHLHAPPDRPSEPQVRAYFLHLKSDGKFASASLVIAHSGIEPSYSRAAPRDWPTPRKLRVRKEQRLPDVLSVDEVRRLIAAVRAHRHRASSWTAYWLGLRLEEGLRLQVGDIDGQRMPVHVRRGKGARDRYGPLPGRTLTAPRGCRAAHRHPTWLSPGRGRDGRRAATADHPMARSSAQKAMSRVAHGPGLRKAISVHSPRRSYATRLLEAGVNPRLIQQYLGHSSLGTTMAYLHLTAASQEQAVARVGALMGPG